MTRPMTGAPLERVRAVRRRGEVARGLLAGLLAAAVIVAVPVALVVFVGDPVPTAAPGGAVPGPVAVRVAARVLACLVWVTWVQFATCLLVEAVACARGTGLPRRVPFATGTQQDAARRLVVPALLLVTASHGLRSAQPPATPATTPTPRTATTPATATARPVAVPASVPAPIAPAPTPAADRVDHAAGDRPALPWDVADAGLLAAGLVASLAAMRGSLAAIRRPGAPPALPDAEAADVEMAAGVGADAAGAAFLDHGLRVLARALSGADRAMPDVYAVRLSTDRLELLLAAPPALDPPPPFLVGRTRSSWILPRTAPLPPAGDTTAPLPGLVCVGTGNGGGGGGDVTRVLVDLESARGTVAVGGDPDMARSLVAAAALELATSPWSRGAHVTLVGFGRALEPLGGGRLRCVDDLGEVVEELAGRLAASRRALAVSGIDSVLTGRLRGLRGDDCRPEFVLLAHPPAPGHLAVLERHALGARRAPVGMLVAGAVPTARGRFQVDGSGLLDTGGLGLTVTAQVLRARSYAALVRLVRCEDEAARSVPPSTPDPRGARPATGPAPAPRPGPGPGPGPGPATVPPPPRPVDPDARGGVLLRILGEPAVEGVAPPVPVALETCLYLALAGHATLDALTAAMWPRGIGAAERDAILHHTARWLGLAADGHPRLRQVGGALTLAGDVRLDWHVFLALVRRGAEGDVPRALDLVRGPFAEPHGPGRYAWLARERAGHEARAHVVDVAHARARRCLDQGDPAGALHAARAGLRAAPSAGALLDVLGDAGEAGGQPGSGTA